MEISFAEKSLRSLCENRAKAEAALGVEAAVMLQRRLADLRAANNVKDLIAGRLNESNRKIRAEFTVDLGGRFSMKLIPNHMIMPLLRSGGIDWKNVSRIKVLRIGKHDDES